MGFTTGFTGGVTLTLGVAYLTVLAHQRNRERQAAVLRQQTYLLHSVIDPLPPVLPPTRTEIAAVERAHFAEAAKDRWNAEIENAVRWVQAKDWTEVREGVETAVGRLWARGLGVAQDETGKTEMKGDSVAAAAKSAYADAKTRTAGLVSKADQKVGEKADEAKGTVMGAIGKGFARGREVLGKAKSAVAGAGEEAGSTVSPAEKIIHQRYEKPNESDQTVEEILAARYTPIDQQGKSAVKAL